MLNSGKQVTGRRIVVVGGGGFLGVNLCQELVAQGAQVSAFGRSCHHLAKLDAVHWTNATLDTVEEIEPLISGANAVVHLAGISTPAAAEQDPAGTLNQSIRETKNLIDACIKRGVDCIVFSSSGGTVYGAAADSPFTEDTLPNPISAYGICKLATEHYLRLANRRYGMHNNILRISNPFGPYQHGRTNQGVVSIFARRILAGEPILLFGDGSAVRDYVYVRDVARALIAGTSYEGSQEVFNIGSGVGRSLTELIVCLEDTLNKKAQVEYTSNRGFDVPVSVLDCTRAERELGWRPIVSWDHGLVETCNWIRSEFDEQGEIFSNATR